MQAMIDLSVETAVKLSAVYKLVNSCTRNLFVFYYHVSAEVSPHPLSTHVRLYRTLFVCSQLLLLNSHDYNVNRGRYLDFLV